MRILSSILLLTGFLAPAAIAETAGQWDSNIYNLIEHPRTVAVRIEITDSDTGMPINNVEVLFKGTYLIEGRNSRHPDGERNEERKDYELMIATDNRGVAITSFGWHKEYPWSQGNDDIEKVQHIQIRRKDYYQVEMGSFFHRVLNVGQRFGSTTQEPAVFDRFEEAWHKECARSDVRFCVFDLGTRFQDFGNKHSTRPEFFEKIYNKDWDKSYEAPRNWFSKGESPQSLCGPYFVYLANIKMKRIRSHEIIAVDADSYPESSPSVRRSGNGNENTNTTPVTNDIEWHIDLLSGIKWAMKGEEVEKILSGRGVSLDFVNSYQDSITGKVSQNASVSGQFMFGQIRIEGIRLGFVDRKLSSVHFVNAAESNADNLYNECVKLYGLGLESTWDDKDVREKMSNPQLCRSCERYLPASLITSQVGYTWSQRVNHYVRYASVTIEDWNASGKSSDEYSKIKARQYKELIEKVKTGENVSCNTCNGTGKCKICSGAGKTYDYKFYPCSYPACGGKGWYVVNGPGGGRKGCSRCNGTGQIKSYKQEEIPCTRCNQTGKCPECKGEGEIKNR